MRERCRCDDDCGVFVEACTKNAKENGTHETHCLVVATSYTLALIMRQHGLEAMTDELKRFLEGLQKCVNFALDVYEQEMLSQKTATMN